MGRIFVGTSGWSYSHWAKGRFYPEGLKQRDWLGFYTQQFRTVEINASFYHVPKPEIITRWCKVAGPEFIFAVKLWRRITHFRRLADCSDDVSYFLDAVKGFGRKKGPLLVQLPPSLKIDEDLLDGFLENLRKAMRRSPWRIVIEFRNKDWLCAPIRKILDRRGAALCLSDMPRCLTEEANDVDFVYLRRHGPGGRYRGCYTPEHIAADANRIKKWLRAGKDVFVYYNNDIGGHAVDNARGLIHMIGQ